MSATGHLAPSQILDPSSSGIASGTQNIFQAYMGPPKAPAETNALEKRNVSIWNMPEAYEGRNLFIKVREFMSIYVKRRLTPGFRTRLKIGCGRRTRRTTPR